MKIEVRRIADEDKKRVKRGLKAAFSEAPAVVILETQPSVNKNAVVSVKIINGPTDAQEQDRVARAVDAVLARFNYRFCDVSHRKVTVHKPEETVPAWNVE